MWLRFLLRSVCVGLCWVAVEKGGSCIGVLVGKILGGFEGLKAYLYIDRIG